ncbi:hypothetical protein LLH00_01310 [bacterium]|nr:hypothetical protein [bacterium]
MKEYILQGQVEWEQMIWIALGGPACTVLATVGTLLWYARAHRSVVAADAVLAGVAAAPFFYTVRFFLAGRGHDGLEWQQAQSALGLAPNGHAMDWFMLGLTLAVIVTWLYARCSTLRLTSVIKAAGLMLAGLALAAVMQSLNNALFDRFFPAPPVTVNAPAGFEEPGEEQGREGR